MLLPDHGREGYGTNKFYAKGNVLERYNKTTKVYDGFDCTNNSPINCGCASSWPDGATPYNDYVNAPFFPSHATIHTATHAFKDVISDCGATMPMLDEHDLRVAIDARDGRWKYRGSYSGSYGFLDHHLDGVGYENYPTIYLDLNEFDTDRDGLPNWWELEVSGTDSYSTVNTNDDPDRDGNTLIERYLEWMATPHFTTQKNRQGSIEMSQYTRGYTKSPVFSVVSHGDGIITINGKWARFQPAKDFKGVTYFEVKVTDSDGDTMVRRIGVRVTE